jgi:hypothetical protein
MPIDQDAEERSRERADALDAALAALTEAPDDERLFDDVLRCSVELMRLHS